MKLEVKYSPDEIETLGIQTTKEFGFAKDSNEIIFMMFTKKIYSNPIGSIVREITSNCFDSHKEAGVTDPVVVRLTKENGEHYISFIDVGVGMSQHRIFNIYAQYFNSTKRDDNNQIGGFGIGGKTPLTYGAGNFFLTTVYEGIRYTYNICKGKQSPLINLLTTEKTTERNGTTVRLQIKGTDVPTFEREINRQLYYFENLIFEGFSGVVQNYYQIIEGNNFLYRGDEYDSKVHICLGRVAYPIDYNVFDNNEINEDDWEVPIAIKLEIGEIEVTVSREAIDYNEATKKLIIKKLKAAKKELNAMLVKQYDKLDTLEDYYKLEDTYSNLILTGDRVLNIHPFVNDIEDDVKIKRLDKILIPSQQEVLHMFYRAIMYGKKKRKEYSWNKSLKKVELEKNVFLIGQEEDMPRKKNAYMKAMMKHFYLVKEIDLNDYQINEIINKITPSNSKASDDVIRKQFHILQNEVIEMVERKMNKYADVVVPDGYSVATGKGYDPNYEIPVLLNSKHGFDRGRYKIADLKGAKATIYYSTSVEESLVRSYDNVYIDLFEPKETAEFAIGNSFTGLPVRFAVIAKSNVKYIKDLKNFKPVREADKLMMRKRNWIVNYVEADKFKTSYKKLNKLFLNKRIFNILDKEYVGILTQLEKIKSTYEKVKECKFSVYSDGNLSKLLKIDHSKINFKGKNLIKLVKEKENKNGMLEFVNIDYDFDPKSDYGNKEKIANIMQLLTLAYIK